jgi:hypothetical protein
MKKMSCLWVLAFFAVFLLINAPSVSAAPLAGNGPTLVQMLREVKILLDLSVRLQSDSRKVNNPVAFASRLTGFKDDLIELRDKVSVLAQLGKIKLPAAAFVDRKLDQCIDGLHIVIEDLQQIPPVLTHLAYVGKCRAVLRVVQKRLTPSRPAPCVRACRLTTSDLDASEFPIQVFNLMGRLVLDRVDVAALGRDLLPNGLYLIKMGDRVEKLVIAR